MTLNIALTNSKEQAQKFADRINGKSYMNFKTEICPCDGQLYVNISTNYEATEEEIKEMLMYVMFLEISK